MTTLLPTPTGKSAELSHVSPKHKAIELAVLKKGTKDYLEFLDTTKELFYGYLYHRTGSCVLARTIMSEIYLDVLSRSMSLLWFRSLSITLLLDAADAALKDHAESAADIDTVYLPTLAWLSKEDKHSVATMHDALWSLPKKAQRFIILSLLLGLPEEHIASVTNRKKEQVSEDMAVAKDLLLERWQPTPSVVTKLNSLVFIPALDIKSETALRFNVVEKYNALRFRRYQWVLIGGLFAVMSNVVVASVLAFAVITEPPTSLRSTKATVASLDAVLLKRQLGVDRAKKSIAVLSEEAKKLAAYGASRDLTTLGLSAAHEALEDEQKYEAEVENIIKLLERARTAMAPIINPVIRLAMAEFGIH
jgi:DNA-directed RNA polymerase specialized sigma24 family protein